MADIKEIADKIRGAENILVALSKDPDVDEVSAALGLTLMLDKIGKKATAIYSGATPDVLKFLKPEETFSTDTNALQDFIIALDKDKADHLRYKVDGDFVKVFITPYKAAISENDLEYSYGDFNVDLIVALDVAEERELDGALVEYGRIMHDAGAVNITTHAGGKFSDTEWSNPNASSVSEMVAELGSELGDDTFEKNSATAILTGIVASTERFANEKTTPETMGVAAKLMAVGADQKLIAENIERAEMGEEPVMMEEAAEEKSVVNEDIDSSADDKDTGEAVEEKSIEDNDIKEPVEEKPAEDNDAEETAEEKSAEDNTAEAPVEEEPTEDNTVEKSAEEKPTEDNAAEEPVEEKPAEDTKTEEDNTEKPQTPILETPSELLGDMPKVDEPVNEESKADEPAVEEPKAEEPLAEEPKVEESAAEEPKAEESAAEEPKAEEPAADEPKAEEPATEEPKIQLNKGGGIAAPSTEDNTRRSVNLQPSAEAQAELEKIMHEEPKKNELLDELNKYSGEQATSGGLKPDVGLSSIDTDNLGKSEVKDYSEMMAAALEGDGGMPNPAVQAAPAVMSGPEANHIPEMDFSQTTDVAPEQPPVMQNGMLEPLASEKPEGAAHEGMTAATEPEANVPGMTQAQEGMSGDILPPPPAPPVNGGIMPPGAEPVTPVMPVVPAMPETTVAPAPDAVAPATSETSAQSATPETPAESTTPEIPASTTPEAPSEPAAPEAPTQVGPAPVNDDPTAFRIPGM